MMLLRTLLGDEHLLIQLLKIRSAVPQCGVRYASDKAELENPENISFLPRDEAELEEEKAAREAKIEKMRDRSGLKHVDRARQNGLCPSLSGAVEYHNSLKVRRSLYGKYGKQSRIDPSILWPSKVEMADMKEYEDIAYPYSAKELVERAKERKKLQEEEIQRQEKVILERVSKVDDEILAFKAKISKQLDKEVFVREKQEKLMKELRKFFGYQISPNDPRVAVLMEKRALEEKKAKKEAKKKKKSEMKLQMMQKYQEIEPKEAMDEKDKKDDEKDKKEDEKEEKD